MKHIELIGLGISVYTRIARVALEEKQVSYSLNEVDIFAEAGPPASYLSLHPFGMIPCLHQDDFVLYETGAITRYVDECGNGAMLQAENTRQRAQMNQVISVLDHYAYRPIVWDVYVQRIAIPEEGGQSNEDLIHSGITKSRLVLQQLEHWRQSDHFLVGNSLTLADLYAYPMLCYFNQTPDGHRLLQDFPNLQEWMSLMQDRDSVQITRFAADC